MEKPQKSHPSCSTIETEDFERRMTLEKFQVNFPQVKNFSQHSLTYTFFVVYQMGESRKSPSTFFPPFCFIKHCISCCLFYLGFYERLQYLQKGVSLLFCKILKQRKISVLFETLFWCPVFIHSFLECIECTSLQLSRILLC